MRINRFLVVFTFFIIGFSSCQKADESPFVDIRSDEKELFYQETQCSDPWFEYFVNNKGRNESRVKYLGEFLNKKDIYYLNLIYKKESTENVVTCTACKCYTGGVFYIKVKDSARTVHDLQELGFKILE